MLRIVNKKNICFIGKVSELIEMIEDLATNYSTLQEAIDDILNN